jgi:hypothetical protein
MLALLLALSNASAFVDPKCADYVLPDDYNEQAQQDFLANYVTLATSLSPQHGPIPHQPGHGAIGLDLGIIPPLGCGRRLVLNGTKTEDTNKSPVVPRIRASFAFPAIGKLQPYAGVAYIPPVPLLGTRNVILSGELGVGVPLSDKASIGGRYHFTMQKTVGEVATPFDIEDPAVDDLYLGSSFGFDALFGYEVGAVTPYLAVGVTDVSTFFYIGDDAVVANNLHPYLGPVASLGADALIKERLRIGAEVFAAPGGHRRLEEDLAPAAGFGRYGHLVTGRLRLALEL